MGFSRKTDFFTDNPFFHAKIMFSREDQDSTRDSILHQKNTIFHNNHCFMGKSRLLWLGRERSIHLGKISGKSKEWSVRQVTSILPPPQRVPTTFDVPHVPNSALAVSAVLVARLLAHRCARHDRRCGAASDALHAGMRNECPRRHSVDS